MTRRIVVLAPNWLGDAVMSLPAVHAIRTAFAGATLDVAARPAIAPMFPLASSCDSVVTLGKGAAAVARLREGAYDLAVLMPNSFNAARLVWQAGIPERWGYRGDVRSWMLTKAVAPPTRLHQIDYYSTLVSRCGCPVDESLPSLSAPEALRTAGAGMLCEAGWDGRTPLVAMSPGAAFGTAKRWPASSFAAVAERLAGDGVQVVLLGARGDREAALEVVRGTRRPPIDLVGQTDLPQLAGVLVHCRTLVTNDSGAMHYAAALGVHVTVMFGPTRERETSPRGAGGQSCFTNPVWCRPCMLRECPLTHRCMTGIAVDDVHAAARRTL